MTKFKLDVKRDVDAEDGVYILNLPSGFRLDEVDLCHTMGFDSMKEMRAYVKHSVMSCFCSGCIKK